MVLVCLRLAEKRVRLKKECVRKASITYAAVQQYQGKRGEAEDRGYSTTSCVPRWV